jgi:hypothetical protein
MTARSPRHGRARPVAEDQTMKDVHDRMPLVTEVCPDEAAVLALSVARFVAAGYMTSDVACWDAAYDAVERVLGPDVGPPLIAHLTAVMRAIRAERQADWRFMPATCCRVTEDERCLMDLLQQARDRRWSEVERRAAAFADAPSAPRLVSAVRVAAEALGAGGARGGFGGDSRRSALH